MLHNCRFHASNEGFLMRDAYHEELDGLSDKLVEMTRLVRSAMARASTALLDADLRLAEEVIGADEHVNKLETEIEETVFDLMARQQPVASDLRTLITALRMSGDLERMGDLAVHLAKTARRRHPESAIPPELQATVLEMGQIAERMIAKAGSVIAVPGRRDGPRARRRRRPDGPTAPQPLRRPAVPRSGSTASSRPSTSPSPGRYFERFADHAVHVAENVVYLVTGQHPEEINEP